METTELVPVHEQQRLYIENCEKFGRVYSALIGRMIGKKIDNSELNFSDDRQIFKTIDTCIQDLQERNQEKFEKRGMDGNALLKQLKAFSSPEQQKLLVNNEGIVFEKLNNGVFLVTVESSLFDKFHDSSAQAFAFRNEDDVSFIVVKTYKGDKYKTDTIDSLKENVPHEFHHIVWGQVIKSGVVGYEGEESMRSHFLMFQDEAIAHIVSDAMPFGYPNLNLMSHAEQTQFEKDNPGKTKAIRDACWEINERFKEITSMLVKRGVKIAAFLKPVMNAKNFEQIKRNMEEFSLALDSIPENRTHSTPELGTRSQICFEM